VSDFDLRYIGIIYDLGNMVHEGYENYKLGLELLGDYLSYVHVKNAVWNRITTRITDKKFGNLPGLP